MKTQNKFNCFQEVTFEKAKDEKTGVTNYKFRSVASDSSKDSDGEEIDADGIDVNQFISSGFVNYNHLLKSNPKALIGEPTKAFVEDGKLIIEGILYGNSQLAQDVVETAEILQKSGSKRRIGMSIEGIPVQRSTINPKRILKAKLTGTALTFSPKNKNTWVELVKGEQTEDFVNYEYEIEKGQDPNGGEVEYLVDINDSEKGVRVTMDKNLTIKIEKAITTDSSSGKSMIPEHLEEKKDKMGEAIITIAKGYKQGLVSEEEKNMVVDVINKKV